ncbi:MAG: hypothetical protein DI570_15200 [Phenylobacterium zucineum]|nr:MAG: hypothetical protein DI570_15200 [Phenylobacterium zucineum]
MMSDPHSSDPGDDRVEVRCRYRTDQTSLQAFLQETFDTLAAGDPRASFSLEHADGGHQTFTARFGSAGAARDFRLRLAEQPQADASAEPDLVALESAVSAKAGPSGAPGV